jgi:hypothetical protein
LHEAPEQIHSDLHEAPEQIHSDLHKAPEQIHTPFFISPFSIHFRGFFGKQRVPAPKFFAFVRQVDCARHIPPELEDRPLMIRWYLGSYGAHPNGTLSYGW